MKYKIIATDIDGTLTQSDGTISAFTRDTLLLAQRKGIRLVLASGRPQQGMSHLAQELQMHQFGGYLLGYNGGFVLKCETGEILYQRILDKEYFPSLFHYAIEAGCDALVYHDDSILTTNAQSSYVQLSSSRNHLEVRQAQDFLAELRHPLLKLLIVGDPDIIPELQKKMSAEFQGKVDIFRSEPFYLECVPPGINKGDCLDVIARDAGCTMQDILAFGDGDNDISMLRLAGHGVAMGNAWSNVKDFADEVTLTHNEDGVALVVERLCL